MTYDATMLVLALGRARLQSLARWVELERAELGQRLAYKGSAAHVMQTAQACQRIRTAHKETVRHE